MIAITVDAKEQKMEVSEAIVGVAVVAVTGAVGWIKSGLNKVTDRQNTLELNVAERHLSKEDTEKMIDLMSAPTVQSLNQVSLAVEKIDSKLDRLLERKEA